MIADPGTDGSPRVERCGVTAAPIFAVLQAASGLSPWSVADMSGFLANPATVGLLGYPVGAGPHDPAGMLLMTAVAGEAEILTVGVLPAARRGGLGRALMDAAGRYARAAGAERLFLEVAANNNPARTLYERAGFREIGRRRNYYRADTDSPIDAICLAVDL